MTHGSSVAGFLPSRHGLHFANRWEPGPTIRLGFLDPRLVGVGDASSGLCGGMAWFVRERFEAGLPIPADTVAPANGSTLFRVVLRRQIRSLDWLRVPLRFWLGAAQAPDPLMKRTVADEWPRIRATLDRGQLAMVGLIRHHGIDPRRLDRDHQVLAFAYSADEPSGGGPPTFTVRLYDPNWPDRDDVTITLSPAGLVQSTGERLLGVIALP